jgi:uncharacterized glyoxalase superfamily protein PhnB
MAVSGTIAGNHQLIREDLMDASDPESAITGVSAMPIQLKSAVPMLMCDDVQESIRFYTEELGFTVTSRADDVGRSGWASLSHGPVKLMLASYGPQPVTVNGRYPQVIFYLYARDVAGLRESVIARGYPAGDLRVTSYGMKEFELIDPSGHWLLIGEETDEACTVNEE